MKPKATRISFDTEFNQRELPTVHGWKVFKVPVVELISIAFVRPDGDEFYAISKEFSLAAAKKNPWLREHVIDQLPPREIWMSRAEIREKALKFLGDGPVKFVDWMIPHDGVLLEQVFSLDTEGLPKNFERCRCNLAQTVEDLQIPMTVLPPQDYPGKHTANMDARWVSRADKSVADYLAGRHPL